MIQAVVVMPWVLFLGTATCLIALGPSSFNNLSTCAPNAFCVCKGIMILAVIFMVLNVHLWDATYDLLHDIHKIGKPLFEMGNMVYHILTFNIVTPDNIWLVFMASKDLCQCIITIGIATIWNGSMFRCHLAHTTHHLPFCRSTMLCASKNPWCAQRMADTLLILLFLNLMVFCINAAFRQLHVDFWNQGISWVGVVVNINMCTSSLFLTTSRYALNKSSSEKYAFPSARATSSASNFLFFLCTSLKFLSPHRYFVTWCLKKWITHLIASGDNESIPLSWRQVG